MRDVELNKLDRLRISAGEITGLQIRPTDEQLENMSVVLTDDQWEAQRRTLTHRIHDTVVRQSTEGNININVFSGGLRFEEALADAALTALGFRRAAPAHTQTGEAAR